jgi:thioredoxin-related protein
MRILSILLFLVSTSFVSVSSEPLEWMNFESAVAAQKNKPKKIFVDVYTDWCGWCKVMDKNTFSNPEIASYLREKFYVVKLNAESRSDITVNGRKYTFQANGSRGVHELAAELLDNKLSYPSTVFIDEDLKKIQSLPGYHDAKAFEPILHFFGDDAYKTTEWEKFNASFKGKVN